MPSQPSPAEPKNSEAVPQRRASPEPVDGQSAGGGASIAIVGGGLAGLAAGCALSSSGFRVTLFEGRPYLGGRASSYEHPATGEIVDNCQHVLFGCCTNLVEFYKTVGIADRIRWFDRMTFIEPGGRQSVLQPTYLPTPLHVMPSFLAFKFLNAWDKLMLARALAALMTRTYKDDGTSFQSWLTGHHQTPAAIERFWKPILVSALSEDLDRMAIPYAAQVVRESMKSRQARTMGIPTVPLSHLYDGAKDYIIRHGGRVRLRSRVQFFGPGETSVRIGLQDSEEQFDYAVLATPFDQLSKLLPESAPSEALRERIQHLETSPITGVHFWFDRQITGLPHAVLLDRTLQWMFHKSLLLGKNVGGSYVELVISSSKSLIEKSRRDILDLALRELREFFPLAGHAKVLKAMVVKEIHATFSPTPGIDRHRPSQETPWPHVFLAGDWTATGWPATMEGAVRSGYLAAQRISGKAFLAPELPAQGLMKLWE